MLKMRKRWRHKGLLVWPVMPWKWAALRGGVPGWTVWNVTVKEG